MVATNNSEEPLLSPNSFACVVLRAVGFIVEVWWKWRMVTEMLVFHCNGLLGSCNDHIEIVVQSFVWISVWSVSLKS